MSYPNFLCARCRAVAHKATATFSSSTRTATSTTTSSTASKILAQPSWSVQSLLAEPEPESTESESESESVMTPAQLNHLLKLSALPPPKSEHEAASMLATLHRQLRFVRAIRRLSDDETRTLEPLRSIRDETHAARREATIGLDHLRQALENEVRVGHYQRPRRLRPSTLASEAAAEAEVEAEQWDALATASKKAGRYFVVESGKSSS